MIFREATVADLPRLLEFEQAVVEYERAFNASIKTGDVKYYDLEQPIEDERSRLIVVELDTEIVGSGYAQNESAVAAYRKAGFKPELLSMSLHLGSESV